MYLGFYDQFNNRIKDGYQPSHKNWYSSASSKPNQALVLPIQRWNIQQTSMVEYNK